MDPRRLKSIFLMPVVLLVIVVVVAVLFQSKRSSDLDGSYWIRVGSGEEVLDKLNTSKHSLRRIEIKGTTVVFKLVSISESAKGIGKKVGDPDFNGNFIQGKITGVTHYRGVSGNCSLDIYSPTELTLGEDSSIIYGSDYLPFFEPVSCRIWPKDVWQRRNFTLHRIGF
jgi:preprotein translocase subunit SecG